MLVERTDRMFEEAARNPERFDRLLRRYQQMRTGAIWTFVGVAIVFLAFVAWFAWEFFCLLHMNDHGGHRPPILLEWMSPPGDLFMLAFFLFCFWVVLSCIMSVTAAIIADFKVKQLILFRALRDGVAQKPSE